MSTTIFGRDCLTSKDARVSRLRSRIVLRCIHKRKLEWLAGSSSNPNGLHCVQTVFVCTDGFLSLAPRPRESPSFSSSSSPSPL
eukprot:7421472-Pyramimonas_sp.AAC.1